MARELGQKYQVCNSGSLLHVCECETVEMADMVADGLEQLAGELDPTPVKMQWLADQPGMQLSCGVYFLGPFGIWYTGNGDVTEMRCGTFTLVNPTRGQVRTLLRLIG